MKEKKRFGCYWRRFKFPHFLSSLVNVSAAKPLDWVFPVSIAGLLRVKPR